MIAFISQTWFFWWLVAIVIILKWFHEVCERSSEDESRDERGVETAWRSQTSKP